MITVAVTIVYLGEGNRVSETVRGTTPLANRAHRDFPATPWRVVRGAKGAVEIYCTWFSP